MALLIHHSCPPTSDRLVTCISRPTASVFFQQSGTWDETRAYRKAWLLQSLRENSLGRKGNVDFSPASLHSSGRRCVGGGAEVAVMGRGRVGARAGGQDVAVVEEVDSFSRYSGYIARETEGRGSGSSDSSSSMPNWDEYNVQEMGSFFQGRPLLVARRLSQIGLTLGWWLLLRWGDEKRGKSDEMFKQRAQQLRSSLSLLGPAFVKIAQAVSSRPDIIPPDYLQELSLLQDRIAPFPTATALQIIEDELGLPADIIFDEISPLPVAAASLGQVYRARLAANGEEVAVKVQRPGVRSAIALDIFILRILAGLFRRVAKLNTDLTAVVDEWATSLFKEMNYEMEALNGIKFRKLFGDLHKVVVPKMFPALTTKRVLIMQWIEGQRLSEVNDLELVEVGVYCSLSQLLDSGFYHADPHPGNLLRTADGKLAYLDFGMMGEVRGPIREALIRASVHLVNREFSSLADDFVRLGLIPPGQKMDEVTVALTAIFQSAIASGVANLSFGNLGANLGRTMYRFKFRIPPYFSLVVRSLTVLEGIALASDPNYKVLASSYPWIARKVLTDNSPQLRETLKDLLYKDGRFQVRRIESLVSESTRPLFSSPAGSASKPSELTEEQRRESLKRTLAFALSTEAGFIRELLLEEVAKGIDAFNRVTFDNAVAALAAQLPLLQPLILENVAVAAEEDDLNNLETLGLFMELLTQQPSLTAQAIAHRDKDNRTAPAENELLAIQRWFEETRDAIQRLPPLGVITELPFEEQQRALLLPIDLTGKVATRVLARSIRTSMARTMALVQLRDGSK